MSKKITKKLLYVVVAIAMLAMMIPAMAVPVSAAGGTLTVKLVDPITQLATVTDGTIVNGVKVGYDVTGSTIELTVTGDAIASWSKLDLVAGTNSNWVVGPGAMQTVRVNGVWGESVITATSTDNVTQYTFDKKWGQIKSTDLTPSSGSSYVTWNESTKSWSSLPVTFTDVVTGSFVNKDGPQPDHVLQGVKLNWYLVDGYTTVPMAAGEAPALKLLMAGLAKPRFTTFNGGLTTNVTDSNGAGSGTIMADGEEAVQVVIVPEYPGDPQLQVVPEVASWNFMTREMEVVPQVRWAGEKIVLEKNFGAVYHNDNVSSNPLFLVRFATTTPGAVLETTGNTYIPLGGGNFSNTPQSVWTTVDANGLASVVLYDANQGQVDVVATLYELTQGNNQNMAIINQHAFTVYYLKLESLVLSDVVGKRAAMVNGLLTHQAGLFDPQNPWDPSLDYEAVNPESPDNDTINVSTDTLLRAQVKGWFTNANPTTRPAGTVDIGGTFPLALPEGRYVLPEDWATLAGPTNWTERRIHWDIMSAPNDGKTYANNPLGDYKIGSTTVATHDVIGPFSPGIELMTDTGWATINPRPDPMRKMQTVVPNGELDAWDAPMPPAKIIFEINSGNGYFKTALKTDIYYIMVGGVKLYTNPFYEIMVPAHEAIPPFDNNGGYDWASFGMPGSTQGHVYGAYPFWQIINQPNAIVAPADALHPTKVEVYSDNHGEAMVWLNGDSNLHLVGSNGGIDIPLNATVGVTKVQAGADYPYFRAHQAIFSNIVTKTWFWSGQILGVDSNQAAPMVLTAGDNNNTDADDYITITNGVPFTDPTAMGTSNKHVVWVWATDRDGMAAGVVNAKVDWVLSGGGARFYQGAAFTGINQNPPYSIALAFDGQGFLGGTNGTRAAGAGIAVGTSYLRSPLPAEAGIFYKFYNPTHDPNGLQPSNFAVAAIDIVTDANATVKVSETITSPEYSGTIMRATNFNPSVPYPLDDQVVLGDANLDGVVNMMDITAVERIILGMDTIRVPQADSNHNMVIDMGDVIRIEKTYLGLK